MDDLQTFTYLMLACERDEKNHLELKAHWGSSRCGGVLELFLSMEDQVEYTDDIGDGDWAEWMVRIAPVQMVLGWEARNYLLAIFHEAGFEPTYKTGEDDCIVYSEQLPSLQTLETAMLSTVVEVWHQPQDKARFEAVLRATVELARVQNRGLMFAWVWGFDYETNGRHLAAPGIKAGLEKHGLKFFTRHA